MSGASDDSGIEFTGDDEGTKRPGEVVAEMHRSARSELTRLRAQRAALNEQIKRLVGVEDRLRRAAALFKDGGDE